MQAGLVNIIHTQIAVVSEISPDIIAYWPEFVSVSWWIELNKSMAMNEHKKLTSNLYFVVWIRSMTFRYIAQHKGQTLCSYNIEAAIQRQIPTRPNPEKELEKLLLNSFATYLVLNCTFSFFLYSPGTLGDLQAAQQQ